MNDYPSELSIIYVSRIERSTYRNSTGGSHWIGGTNEELQVLLAYFHQVSGCCYATLNLSCFILVTEKPSSHAIGFWFFFQPHSLTAPAVCPLIGLFSISPRCQSLDAFPKSAIYAWKIALACLEESINKWCENFTFSWPTSLSMENLTPSPPSTE